MEAQEKDQQPVPYKIVDAADAKKGDLLYFPSGVPKFPPHWLQWSVVKVTKNTVQIRHGRAGAYIKTDATFKKLKRDGTPQKICILQKE